MRVIQIVPAVGHEASGPSYSVTRLCEALARREGAQVSLHVLDLNTPPREERSYRLEVHRAWPVARRLGISPAMRRALEAEARECDILHNHSLWMLPNVYPGLVAKDGRAQLVVSPRGTLSRTALERSRLRKAAMWWLGRQRLTLKRAAMFHATAEHEYEDIRRLGYRAPVAIIPNGIDVPDAIEGDAPAPNDGPRRLLFFGRIHPIKGLEHLVRAWARVAPRHGDWELVIAGPDNEGHLAELQRLVRDLGAPRIAFPGPRYGAEKAALYRSAELYVLPSLSENFAMTVAEALAQGTPCIVTKGAPWSRLESEACGWWIDIGAGPLAACLDETLALAPDDLRARGERGRDWMRRDFAWDRIAALMFEAYRSLLQGGKPPAHVRTD